MIGSHQHGTAQEIRDYEMELPECKGLEVKPISTSFLRYRRLRIAVTIPDGLAEDAWAVADIWTAQYQLNVDCCYVQTQPQESRRGYGVLILGSRPTMSYLARPVISSGPLSDGTNFCIFLYSEPTFGRLC